MTFSALGFLHKLVGIIKLYFILSYFDSFQILDIRPFVDCGSHVTLSISIFLTIAIAIERYQVGKIIKNQLLE